MKFLKALLVVVVIVLVAAVIMGATADSEYKVERSVVVDACYGDIYDNIADFHAWNDWGPWAKNDPSCEYSYEGDMAAVGMTSLWSGDPEITGTGSMVCTEISEDGIVFDLDFETPRQSTSQGSMLMSKVDGGYEVTWTSWGEFDGFMEKLFMGVFMDIDEMMGPMFEQGLGDLKTMVEAMPRSDFEPEMTDMAEFHYLGQRMDINTNDLTAEIYAAAFGAIGQHMAENGIIASDVMMPMSIWEAYDQETEDGTLVIAMAVTEAVSAPEGLVSGTVPGGPCMVGKHFGPYDSTGEMWMNMEGYTACNKIELGGNPIEMYANDPSTVSDPSEIETHIIYPLAAAVGDADHSHDDEVEDDHHHHEDGEGDHEHEEGDEGHEDDHDHAGDAEATEAEAE